MQFNNGARLCRFLDGELALIIYMQVSSDVGFVCQDGPYVPTRAGF